MAEQMVKDNGTRQMVQKNSSGYNTCPVEETKPILGPRTSKKIVGHATQWLVTEGREEARASSSSTVHPHILCIDFLAAAKERSFLKVVHVHSGLFTLAMTHSKNTTALA